jgi:hypothetical protein
MIADLRQHQHEVCRRFGATPAACPGHLKVGISRNVREGVLPINGVRVDALETTTGWFIWAGEWSDDPDFFVPLCVEHVEAWCPLAARYLLLPTGWRFLLAPDLEDVWFDAKLCGDGRADA